MTCNLHHIFIHLDLGDIRIQLYLEIYLKQNEMNDYPYLFMLITLTLIYEKARMILPLHHAQVKSYHRSFL